jgi:hypothetical protein
MKNNKPWAMMAMLVVSLSCISQRCEASESACDSLPRIIGAFGAENNVGSLISLASNIRAQLPKLHQVRRVLNTNISPTGEQTIIYDSDADESDPHPKVAFLVGGHIVKLLDGSDFNPRGGGFERYLSSCEFDLARNQRALALAITSGYDGAGSVFSIIRWQSGDYRVVFNQLVGQGRMELGILKLELWSSVFSTGRKARNPDSLNFECIWCPHHYLVTEYFWRDDNYIKAGSIKTQRTYDPAEISGTPLLVKARTGKNFPENR